MKYRSTSDNVLEISEIGLGTYALAGVYGEKDASEFERILRKAVDLGVTFFDTAPVYGMGEEILGKAIRPVRDRIVLSTKVAASLGGERSCSFESVVGSCEASLKQLKTDHIDLYQIHFDDGATPTAEVVRAFEHLKARGKIRAYGIGHVGYGRAAEYLKTGQVSTLMGELNAASRKYYLKMLPLMRSGGPGYIGFSLTARGILTGAYEGRNGLSEGDIRQMDAVFYGERAKSALRIRDKLGVVGRDLGASPAQVAIRWALEQGGVVTGLVGPSTPEHLEEDIAASDLVLSEVDVAELDRFIAAEDERLAGCLLDEIKGILASKVGHAGAAGQLVYALEGLAELDLADEGELVGHMRSIFGAIKAGGEGVSSLEAVRKALAKYVEVG